MPIYEYRCQACGGRYEALVARTDRAVPHCPRCGATRAERLISTFAVGRPRAREAPTGSRGFADGPRASCDGSCQCFNPEASA